MPDSMFKKFLTQREVGKIPVEAEFTTDEIIKKVGTGAVRDNLLRHLRNMDCVEPVEDVRGPGHPKKWKRQEPNNDVCSNCYKDCGINCPEIFKRNV